MDNYTNKAKLPQSVAAAQPKNVRTAPKDTIQNPPRPAAACKPTHEEIARRAHQIYIDKGMPQGQSEQIWQQAEKELLSRG